MIRDHRYPAGRPAARLISVLGGLGLVAALVLALPARAGASPATETWSITATETTTGAASPPPNLFFDCFTTDTGFASCPQFATASLFPPTPVFPPSPNDGAATLGVTSYATGTPTGCVITKLHGDLSVSWSDGNATDVTFTGSFKEAHPILDLEGTVSASSTDFAGWQFKATLNGFPPNPCTPSTNTITGTFSLFPPVPI
jgi:hypothetical protein